MQVCEPAMILAGMRRAPSKEVQVRQRRLGKQWDTAKCTWVDISAGNRAGSQARQQQANQTFEGGIGGAEPRPAAVSMRTHVHVEDGTILVRPCIHAPTI